MTEPVKPNESDEVTLTEVVAPTQTIDAAAGPRRRQKVPPRA